MFICADHYVDQIIAVLLVSNQLLVILQSLLMLLEFALCKSFLLILH